MGALTFDTLSASRVLVEGGLDEKRGHRRNAVHQGSAGRSP